MDDISKFLKDINNSSVILSYEQGKITLKCKNSDRLKSFFVIGNCLIELGLSSTDNREMILAMCDMIIDSLK